MRNKSTTLWTRTVLVPSFLLLIGLQSTARAETYTYTGNAFGPGASTPYLATDFVSGSFADSLLGDSLALATISPTSFSFSDGVQTFSNTTPGLEVTFKVGTDASGNINAWDISLTSGINIISTTKDPSQEDFGTSGGGLAINFFDAGSWQASSGGGGPTVPEPGYPMLIALGMVAIAAARRRMQRVGA